MNHCTKADFSRLIKLTKQSVTRALKRGEIKITDDGLVDIDHPLTLDFLKARRSSDKPIVDVPQETDVSVDDSIDLGKLSKLDLDRIKIIEAIKTSKQKRLADRQDLVSRAAVSKVINTLFRIHVNQFRTLDQNVLPDIAAVYGVDDSNLNIKAAKVLSDEVYKILRQIKSEFIRFLSEYEGDEDELERLYNDDIEREWSTAKRQVEKADRLEGE